MVHPLGPAGCTPLNTSQDAVSLLCSKDMLLSPLLFLCTRTSWLLAVKLLSRQPMLSLSCPGVLLCPRCRLCDSCWTCQGSSWSISAACWASWSSVPALRHVDCSSQRVTVHWPLNGVLYPLSRSLLLLIWSLRTLYHGAQFFRSISLASYLPYYASGYYYTVGDRINDQFITDSWLSLCRMTCLNVISEKSKFLSLKQI